MRDPALVFGAELARPVDAAHAHHRATQPEHARVVPNILVGGPFRTSIGTMKIEWGFFADAGLRRPILRLAARAAAAHLGIGEKAAVHLVGRGKQNRCCGIELAHRFKHVQRAACVNLKIVAWMVQASRDRDLRGQMDHCRRARDCFIYCFAIANISCLNLNAIAALALEPMCILMRAVAGETVEHGHVLPAPRERRRDATADEACAPGNQNRPLVVLGHATSPLLSSSLAACSTRSSATWPDSHSANSASASRKSVRGSKPSMARLCEMSAKQCRMSPARYLPST